MEIRQIRQQHSRPVTCNSMIDMSKFISEYEGGEIGGFPSIFFHIFNAITVTYNDIKWLRFAQHVAEKLHGDFIPSVVFA